MIRIKVNKTQSSTKINDKKFERKEKGLRVNRFHNLDVITCKLSPEDCRLYLCTILTSRHIVYVSVIV